MSSCETPNGKKETENFSTTDSEDENLITSGSHLLKSKSALIKYEIVNIKTIPSIFFVLFLIVFCCIMVKFVPNVYITAHENHFLHMKSSVKSLPQYFCDQSVYIKVLILGSQMFYLLMIISLSSLMKQRISVPELTSEKSKYYLLLFFGLVTFLSLTSLTFFHSYSSQFWKKFTHFEGDPLFVSFIVSGMLVFVVSYALLSKIDIIGVPKDREVMNYKRSLLYMMLINSMLYITCICLVDMYKPIYEIEKFFISFLVLARELNCIMFLLEFMLFSLSLKFDLMYVHLNLNLRPDIEYFMESGKLDLKSVL